MNKKNTKPILRWAGGKRNITKYLINLMPADYENYWEPFLGSGALFFAVSPKQSYLSDSNRDLIYCYKYLSQNPELIYKYLKLHIRNSSKEYYYQIRDEFNRCSFSAAQAARFIFLNRTCFNGIYRVNQSGFFNVPYGYKEPPPMPTFTEIDLASRILKNAEIMSCSFESILDNPNLSIGDFVYIDPPYPPVNGINNSFTHYTNSRFYWEDQKKVSAFANELSNRNCKLMISNLDHYRIHELYTGWRKTTLPVTRFIAANGKRVKVSELILINY
jgi:DNA adenine methylase